MPSLPKIESA